jgi:Legionella pneumophila major outer membrane protein precursor
MLDTQKLLSNSEVISRSVVFSNSCYLFDQNPIMSLLLFTSHWPIRVAKLSVLNLAILIAIGCSPVLLAQEGPTYEGLLKLSRGANSQRSDSLSGWRSFGGMSGFNGSEVQSSGLGEITGFLFGREVDAGSMVHGEKSVVPQRGSLYLQVEEVWVRPELENSRALNRELVTPRDVNFRYDRSSSERFEIGYLNPTGNLGFRARIWQFGDTTDPVFANDANGLIPTDAIVIFAGGGVEDVDTVTVTHEIDLDVVDLEATKPLGANAAASFGLRMVNFDQNYLASTDEGLLDANLDFLGVGPTFSVEGALPISQGPFSLFGSARASAVAGEKTLESNNIDTINGGAANILDEDTDFIFNADLKAGIEWKPACLSDHGFYTRAGVEYQYWGDIGNLREISDPALDDTFIGPETSTLGNYGGDIDFFGITVSAGLKY